MSAIREQIAAWLQQTAESIAGLTAYRPRRLYWTEPLSANGAAVVRQTAQEAVGTSEDIGFYRQTYEVSIAAIDADSATGSFETAAGRWAGEVAAAFETDPSCGGLAMAGGLIVLGTEMRNEDGRFSGAVVRVQVDYSCLIAAPQTKGVS